jgi:flagellar hook-length control protein FliK
VLNVDTTAPAASLPASHANAAAAASGAAKNATDAFGDLLALVTGQQAGRAGRTPAPAGATRVKLDPVPGVPFPFPAPVAGKANGAAKKESAPAQTIADDTTIAGTDPHAADDRALADNLTWLIAMAAAPKPDAAAPAPATFAGDATAETSKDATACADVLAKAVAAGVSTAPQAAADPADMPGVHPRAVPQAASKAAPSGPASLAAPTTPSHEAVAAPALEAAIRAAGLPGASPASETPQAAPRAAASNAPAAGDEPKAASAPAATASAFVPVPATESRPGDSGGSPKHDARGSDDRPADSPLPKLGASAQAAPIFQAPLDVRAQASSPASAAESVPASRADVPAEAELPRQIVQAIRMQWADGVGDARIRLQPEYLGELSIAIRVEHGSVTASLESNTPSVREWIDNNQPMLRQALAEHGLHLDRLTVTEEQAQPDWTGNEHPQQQQQEEEARQARRARRQNGADAPAFEMVA